MKVEMERILVAIEGGETGRRGHGGRVMAVFEATEPRHTCLRHVPVHTFNACKVGRLFLEADSK